MSAKTELIQEFLEGKMDKNHFVYDAVNYTGMVICKIVYGIDDAVFGYVPNGDEKKFFLARIYYVGERAYFMNGGSRYYIENFLKGGVWV